MSADTKNNFKTREWWMLIVLIIVIQWIIHFWSTEAMSSNEMVSYVSFAGTLVSTILAVLAIIYSFIQSASQQNSSEIISREVYRLQDIVSEVNSSAERVNMSLEKLPNIIDQLERIPHTVSDTIKQGVIPLKEQNDGMQAQLSVLASALSSHRVEKSAIDLNNGLSESNTIEYIVSVQIVSLALSAYLITTRGHFNDLYIKFRSDLSKDLHPIVDQIFISTSTMLGNHFLYKKISDKYCYLIEQNEGCSDVDWGEFILEQERMLDSYVKVSYFNTLEKYLTKEILFEINSLFKK